MKKQLTALAFLVTIFTACQKEPSFEDPNRLPGGGNTGGPGGATNGNRLVRIGTRVGTDTVTTDYAYNSAGRLTRFSQSAIINSMPFNAELRYVRNAANIVTSVVNKNDALAQFGLDSVEAFITYDAANQRYKHSITRITSFGNTDTDSVVYFYSAGKLTEAINYYDDGTGYVSYSKETYAYSGTNLTEIKSYTYDDSINDYELVSTITSVFDSKKSPTAFADEAPILGMALYYSANNRIKNTKVDTNPAATTVNDISYTYNAADLPIQSITKSGATVLSTNNYYYQ